MIDNTASMVLGKRVPLEAVVRRMLTTDNEGACTRIAVLHVVDSGSKEVEVFHAGPFVGSKWTPELFTKNVIERTQVFAQDMPNVQQFRIVAFYGGRTEIEDHHYFNVNNASQNMGTFTEGPDERGIKAQTMRHVEGLAQMYMRGNSHLSEVQARTIEAMAHERETLRRENFDMMNIFKEMMIEKVNQNHEHEMKRISAKRAADLQNQLLKLVPAFANTITGRDIIPQSTEDTAIVEMFAESVKPEQLGMLISVLPPELAGVLVSRFKKHEDKKRAEEESTAITQYSNGAPIESEFDS